MELVCRLLEVSRSGYYEWLGRKPSLRRQKDQELKRRLLSLHQRYPKSFEVTCGSVIPPLGWTACIT